MQEGYVHGQSEGFGHELEIERNKKGALWTNHALVRAMEIGVDLDSLMKAWRFSCLQELSAKRKAYKFSVYGMDSLYDKFFWSEAAQLLFTVHCPPGKRWHILTVTEGRGNQF